MKHVITGTKITFVHEGKVYEIMKSAKLSFSGIAAALQENDYAKAVELYKTDTLETDKVKVKKGNLQVKGTDVVLGEAYAEAFLYANAFGGTMPGLLDGFFENVAKNPDPVARNGLASFISHQHMPITDRGTFLAYRRVTHDMLDPRTQKMDNMIGCEVKMDRKDCDSDPHKACSRGLHVCHHEYGDVSGFPIVVEINPRDVVCVPDSYNALKMRCCRFRVLCSLSLFKRMLLVQEQAALGKIPVLLTEQTRNWDVLSDIPARLHSRYKPVDAWEWAAA